MGVHVSPESDDVQMYPFQTVAASLVPSLEDVAPIISCVPVLTVVVASVHVEARAEASVANESNTASRTRSMVLGSTSSYWYQGRRMYARASPSCGDPEDCSVGRRTGW